MRQILGSIPAAGRSLALAVYLRLALVIPNQEQ